MLTKAQLLSAATAVGAGPTVQIPVKEHQDFFRAYMASLTGGTSVAVNIEVSLDGKGWAVLADIHLAAGEADGVSSMVPWKFVRANITAISGGGSVDAMVVTGAAG